MPPYIGSSILSLPLTLPPAHGAYGPEVTLNPEPVNGYGNISMTAVIVYRLLK